MKFKRTHTTVVILLLILVGFQVPVAASQSQSSYKYGFISRQENAETSLQVVDFDGDVPKASNRFDITLPDGMPIQLVKLNTAGTWIALVLYSPRNPLIKLVNMVSGETRDISTLDVLIGDDVPGDTDQQTVAWSPDSRYLAVIDVNENARTDIYLYAVETGVITALTNDSAQQQSMVWSPDSSKIAVLTETCSKGICHSSIDSIDVESKQQLASVLVGQRDELYYNTLLCNLEWSPDSRYLTYIDGCDTSIIDSPKMVYLLDWQTQTSTLIIDYSSRADVPSNSNFAVRFASYDPFWYDNQNLIVGTVFGIGDVFEGKADSETIVYNVSNQNTASLSKTIGEDWQLNATADLIAFRSSRVELLTVFTPLNPSIQIGHFNGNAIKILTEAPAGCDLAWSPNENVLAYTDRGQPFTSCSHRIQGFNFVNGNTGQLYQYQATEGSVIYPLGWIAAA